MPPDKDTQWPEVVIYANGRVAETAEFAEVEFNPEVPEERYLPISSIRKRLTSDEATEALADQLAVEAGWQSAEEYEAWEHNDPDELPSFRDDARSYLKAVFTASFPDTKDKA
jgi:hypothetical protein